MQTRSWHSDRKLRADTLERLVVLLELNFTYIHTYLLRFIPEGVAEVSQIFLPRHPRFTKMS
jgi:hypothetical protein